MGLGKTAQAITAADKIAAKNIIVICPAVARINWDREFRKFSARFPSKQICVACNTGTPLPAPSPRGGGLILILSYELAVYHHTNNAFDGQQWDLCIIDEAHFLKSIEAKRTKAILGSQGIIRQAQRTWALTGTPMPNHPGELWTLLYVFGGTKLKYQDFIQRFCNFIPGSGFSSGNMRISGLKQSNALELKEILKSVCLRRLKKDVLKELPPVSVHSVAVERNEVELTEEEIARVKEELGFLAEVPSVTHLEMIASSVSTLRRYLGLAKVKSCAEMIASELESDAYPKIVIFAYHKEVIRQMFQALHKFGPVAITGDTSPTDRQANVDRFQTKSSCRVFLGNIRAAGTAITLTAADQVFFVEQDWTPSENAQALSRCHRIGQQNPVTVRFAAVSDSIDERVAGVLARKARDFRTLFDS